MESKRLTERIGSGIVGPYTTAGRVHKFWREERIPDMKKIQQYIN
jgi:hypothetical protein